MTDKTFQYDVGLSFAGEQRDYVEGVARELKSRGIRVFYDDYEKETLWGKDLYAHLHEVYHQYCRYCVIFVSMDYAKKVWPNKERESAQARALENTDEYILPARFDDTPIPGLPDTIGYVDLRVTTREQLIDLILAKLGAQVRHEYLPPSLDRLFEDLGIVDNLELKETAACHAYSCFEALRRMSDDERDAVISTIRFGCPADMPENVHIHTDFLRRVTGKPEATLARLLGGIESLGFRCSTREDSEHRSMMLGVALRGSTFFRLSWLNLSSSPANDHQLPPLDVADAMIRLATENYCEQHGAMFLERLDFSQLASATATRESHDNGEANDD